MLSGALLLQPAKLNEPIKVFLKKRLTRIGLAFVFWSGTYIAWSFYTANPPVVFTLENLGQSIVRSLFSGAYYHFWFIYLIVGLYLITPFLRAVIAGGNWRVLRYLVLLWFAGVAVVPLTELVSGQVLNSAVFLFGGFVGYFVLGIYLQRVKLQSAILYGLIIVGFVGTIFGVWLMNYPLSALMHNNYFFRISNSFCSYRFGGFVHDSSQVSLRLARNQPQNCHSLYSRHKQKHITNFPISHNNLGVF